MLTRRLYANVGNRDIALAGDPIDRQKDQKQATLRDASGQILADLEAFAPDLSLPILEPALRRLIDADSAPADEVVLFCTDQQHETHRKSDTVHVAAILARELPRRGLCRAVRIEAIAEAPNRLDRMSVLYRDWIAAEPAPEPARPAIALLSGGVPACNFALLYTTSVAWGERVEAWQVDESAAISSFPFGRELLARDRRTRAQALLDQWDLDGIRYIYPHGTEARTLGDFAHARLSMDLDRARELARASAHKPVLESTLAGLDARRHGKPHVAEAFWQAQLFHDRAQWTEMVARLHLLVDVMLDWIVAETVAPHARGEQDVLDAWRNSPRWSPALYQSNFTPGSWDDLRFPHKSWVVERSSLPIGVEATKLSKWLKQLRKLRNASPAGHGFKPVTADAIARASGEASPDAALRKVHAALKAMGVLDAASVSPWKTLRDLLSRSLPTEASAKAGP